MSKLLLRNLFFLIALTSCSTSSHNVSSDNSNSKSQNHLAVISSNASLFDETDSVLKAIPSSLMELPQTQDGEIVLSDGFYEADFRSYCLQPGTPSPSDRDAYLQGPLSSYRKEIVETILRGSLNKPELEQKNIQLLLWSVVSGSDFNRLSWDVQQTAGELLSRKQIFELKGGVIGIIKTVSAALPESSANSTMKKLFESGTNSYEAYERIAVLQQSSQIKRPEINKDQWYKQDGGYYLRYFPSGYQKIKIQVYVPKGTVKENSEDILLFDPVTMMAIPANSNSQRLGIGAPITDILRKIINIQRPPTAPKKIPAKNSNPKLPKT